MGVSQNPELHLSITSEKGKPALDAAGRENHGGPAIDAKREDDALPKDLPTTSAAGTLV